MRDETKQDGSAFKYDLAFSFLKDDEGVAAELNNLLGDGFSTFLYSKKQEHLAGRDGEEEFNRVFGKEARAVVVLYRPEWGTTPWTRIEETAIRNRAYNEGYDFVLFVPLGPSPTVPKYLPKTRLWLGLDRWGVKAAAAIIENFITSERGATSRPSTIEDKTARVARQVAAEKERERLYGSEEGVRRGANEAQRFFEALDSFASGDAAKELGVKVAPERQGRALHLGRFSLSCVWSNSYSNTLKDTSVVVVLWDGAEHFGADRRRTGFAFVDVGGRRYLSAAERRRTDFQPDFDSTGEVIWREKGRGDELSTSKLVDACVSILLNQFQRENQRRQ